MTGYGYQTAAFFNVVFLSSEFGFHKGFSFYSCMGSFEEELVRDAEGTVDDVQQWLEGSVEGQNCYDPESPLFLVVHFYDPHLTYSPPSPYNTMFTDTSYMGVFDANWGGKEATDLVKSGAVVPTSDDIANLEALYDGEIAYVDNSIGRLVSILDSHDLMENTWLIITADHGEEFYEHSGVGHGHTLYQELISVPLILIGPGLPSGVDSETVAAQTDILPTVFSACGYDVPEWAEGKNLLIRDTGFTNRTIPSSFVSPVGPWVAVRRGDSKLHWILDRDISVQFDLDCDPQESVPLEEADSSLMEEAMLYWSIPPRGNPPLTDMNQAIVNSLRELGYI